MKIKTNLSFLGTVIRFLWEVAHIAVQSPGMLVFIGAYLLKVITMSYLQIKAVYHNKGTGASEDYCSHSQLCIIRQLQSCPSMRLWHQHCALI